MAWSNSSRPAIPSRNTRSFLSHKTPSPRRATRRLAVESLERRELLTVGPASAVIDLQGTDGNDTFEFAAGDEAGTWQVTLNGTATVYDADLIHVKFDGGEGYDSAVLLGTDLADSVTLAPGRGAVSSGAYSIEIEQMEKISVDAGGGANMASLSDGAGDDRLDATPNSATLSGDGFENTVTSVSQVRVYSQAGGEDVGFLHDNPNGADRFVSGPGWGKLLGEGYGTRAFGFSRVYVYATEGGNDKAVLDDMPGNRDKFLITPEVVKLNGSGGARRLFGFADVRVDSTPGDHDRVKIYGDPTLTDVLTTSGGNVELSNASRSVRAHRFFDTRVYSDDGVKDVAAFNGTPSQLDQYVLSSAYSKSAGDDYRIRAYSFDRVSANGEPDLDERVIFNGAARRADTFTATSGSAKLASPGFVGRAEGFNLIYAYATPGDGDKARLFADGEEPEYFEADPKVGVLRSTSSHIQVRHFEQVNAYATPGSTDAAVMYTSEDSVNEFTGTPQASVLEGDGFSRKAIGFRYVHAYATSEVKHVATLTDSDQNDVFVATSEYGKLSGPDYMTRVVSFHEVRADASSGGDDEAVLYDSDGVDHLEAGDSFARITRVGAPRNFFVEATAFERVRLHSSSDDDVKDIATGSVEWIERGSAESDFATDEAIYGPIPEETAPPNVVFLAVDDLNDWVGVLGGYASVQTPNMDRLAARGVTFSNAYCPAPFCNPSRAAVLTGYYPTTSGVYKNGEDWRVAVPEAVTLPELFQANGYETVGGGKISHWNDRIQWDEYYPSITNPEPEADVRQSEDNSAGILSWGALDVPDEETNDHRITSWAADYLHEQHSDPFFLACGVFRPHVPLDVPEEYFDLYPLDEIVLPEAPADDLDDVPTAGRELAEWDNLHTDLVESGNQERVIQAYLASVSFADAQIGRVLDALDSSEYAENTVVALWSDHGMHFGEKNYWKKGTLWEEATRVPLIVAGPGVAESGSISEHPVDLVNLYPTLADMCDLPVDDSLDGVSLRPLLEDPDAEWDRPALMNHRDANAVRYQNWRYIRYGDGSEELYDHGTDPNEWTNLADLPAYESVKADLASMLPQSMALEVPKRAVSPLHWDTVESESVSAPIASGDRLFYSEFDRETGRELWGTDGNTAPAMVADIHPGPGSSNPNELVDWNGTTYFRADDGVHGSELWRTDGTESGTQLVCDIRPGNESSGIGEIVRAGDKLFFRADDGTHGVELWCSDGTPEGTALVRDIVTGVPGSYPTELTVVGTDVFFQAHHPEAGTELWRSDGTSKGTELVADILPGGASSIPRELTATAEGVFFQASDGLHGRELWYSAGTAASTRLVQDLQSGSRGSDPEQLAYTGAALYFVAADAEGRGLWKHDTTGPATLLHREAHQMTVVSAIGELTSCGTDLYFRASDGEHGAEIWRTDGSVTGTGMVADLWTGGFGSSPTEFTPIGNGVAFAADDGIHGFELWTSDGTAAGTRIVTDLFPGERTSAPRFLTLLGEALLAFATDGASPYQLWRMDDGTLRPLADLSPLSD